MKKRVFRERYNQLNVNSKVNEVYITNPDDVKPKKRGRKNVKSNK